MVQPEIISCPTCGQGALPEFPHRHSDGPPRRDYNPMDACPGALPELISRVRDELRGEDPTALHVNYLPGEAMPVAVSQYSAEAAGFVVDESQTELLLDVGPLGSPPWSPRFQNRVGSWHLVDGRYTITDKDWMRRFPWSHAVQKRLPNHCRRAHVTRPDMWREHRGEAICQSVVGAVMAGQSVAEVASDLNIEQARCAVVVDDALRRVWSWAGEVINDLDMRRVA